MCICIAVYQSYSVQEFDTHQVSNVVGEQLSPLGYALASRPGDERAPARVKACDYTMDVYVCLDVCRACRVKKKCACLDCVTIGALHAWIQKQRVVLSIVGF